MLNDGQGMWSTEISQIAFEVMLLARLKSGKEAIEYCLRKLFEEQE